jgi:multiple sugar transport system substrate-binding protein
MDMKMTWKSSLIVVLAVMMILAGCASSGNNNTNGNTNGGNTNNSNQAANTNTPNTTGEQPTSADPIELRISWWGGQARHDATNQVLSMYTELHPHVTFLPEFQGFDGYFQKLTLQATTNNMPDVMQFYVGSADTQQFYDKGLIASLDGLLGSDLLDVSDISESALSTGKMDGVLYGIPLGLNAYAFVVDKEAYAAASLTIPEHGYDTWEQLEDHLVKLKAVTGQYGADDLLTLANTFRYYARMFGQTQYAEGTGIGFDEQVYVSFYQMKKRWIEQGLIPPYDVILTTTGIENSMIVKGSAAVSTGYSNQIGTFAQATGKEYQLVPLPGSKSAKVMDLRGSSFMSISEGSKNKEETARFISYFINDIEANKVLNAERGIPVASKVRDALKDGFNDAQLAGMEYINLLTEQDLASPIDPPPPAGATEIERLMMDLEQQILFNVITPEEAYATLKEEALKIIERNS